MIQTDRFEQVEITHVQQLREWLMNHHDQSESIWLVTFKKNVPSNYVDRWDVLDELICFGWIDGIRRKLDDQRTMQLISPRRVQHWAQTYKDRAARLIAEDRMHQHGLKSIAESKKAGLWDFMADVDRLETPKDLQAALANDPQAHTFYTQLADAKKRFALRWLKLAKTDETRARRIAKIIHHFSKGETLPGS